MSKNTFIELYKDSPLLAILRARNFKITQRVINDWELEALAKVARSIH